LEPDALEVKDAPSHIECMAVKCAVCSSYSLGEEGCQQVAVEDAPAEEGGLPHLLAVAADGCAKAVRRKVAGTKDTSAPVISRFAAAAHKRLEEHEASGEPQDKDTLHEHCTSTLTCANASSYKHRLFATLTTMSLVCRHCVPLYNGMCHSSRHETFMPFRMLFSDLLKMYIISVLMYDNGCRLSKSFNETFGGLLGDNLPLLLIGWLHALGHTECCRLLFSGQFHGGIGRTVGESTETLWSKFLNWAITSKMSKSRRHDFLESVMERISNGMASRMPEMLFDSWALVCSKRATGETKVDALLAEASALGFSRERLDSETAAWVAVAKTKPDSADADRPWQATLAKCLILADYGISPETHLAVALNHGCGGARKTAAARALAKSAANKIEAKEGIHAFNRAAWEPDGECFAAGAAQLAACLVNEAQEMVCVGIEILRLAKEADAAAPSRGNDKCGACLFALPCPPCAAATTR
jgi:hypothetical protein